MANTRRSRPVSKTARQARMEREWERQVQALKDKWEGDARLPAEPKQPVPQPQAPPGERQIEALTEEAERAIATKAESGAQHYSRQDPPAGKTVTGGGLLWWSGGNVDDYIPLAEYGTQQRQTDLRAFALVAPMVLIAESVLIKKMQALQWSIESGRNRAIHWQGVLNGLEQDRGWDTFVARWTRSYCESDYGGYAEIIRSVPSWALDREGKLTDRGEQALRDGKDRAWPIVDAMVMDPCRCLPSADPAFPLQYYNSYSGKKHYLRRHQFMHILDMPNVDDSVPHQGTCAISRAVWAAQEDRMTTRYGFEALSENPGTGMILANVNQNLLETALSSAKGQRDARGVVYYKGLIFLPVLDPSGNVKLEYLTFSHLPENFNRTEDYNRIKEIVASAFGMDVLELGSIPGHNLGTAQQANVAASKARGKGMGALIQGIEREFRHKFLPADVQLRIKKHDIDEQKDRAELDAMYFQMATQMVQVGAWDPVLANQYLADQGAIEAEFPYMAADLTPSEELDDTEATEKRRRDGPRCRIDRNGTITDTAHPFTQYAEKRLARVQPRREGTLPDLSAGIEDEDVDRATAQFARSHPQYAAMLGVAGEA